MDRVRDTDSSLLSRGTSPACQTSSSAMRRPECRSGSWWHHWRTLHALCREETWSRLWGNQSQDTVRLLLSWTSPSRVHRSHSALIFSPCLCFIFIFSGFDAFLLRLEYKTRYVVLIVPLSFSVLHFLAHVKDPRPTGAPLSHRKHCSWNASPVVPPLILWLCDITLRHHVKLLHNLFLVACLVCENWFRTAALLLLAVPAQACVSRPIRAGRFCLLCEIRFASYLREKVKNTDCSNADFVSYNI